MAQLFPCEFWECFKDIYFYSTPPVVAPGLAWRYGICSNSPALNGRLPIWEDSSRPPVSHWNLLFWDDSALLVRYSWIFHVYHTFYKLEVKILAAINEIQSVRCSWSLSWPGAVEPRQQKTYYFSTTERTPGKFSLKIDRKSLKTDTVCNF